MAKLSNEQLIEQRRIVRAQQAFMKRYIRYMKAASKAYFEAKGHPEPLPFTRRAEFSKEMEDDSYTQFLITLRVPKKDQEPFETGWTPKPAKSRPRDKVRAGPNVRKKP